MRVGELSTRGCRNLADGALGLASGLTVVHGPNGAGKTNLLEALFFALTGRSCRTRREREMIAFGGQLARAGATLVPEPGTAEQSMTMVASISTGEGRQRRVDGRRAQPDDDRRRPAVSVFMPDRLALIKGSPKGRRAHLDRLVGALWPARVGIADAYRRALAQRNAMLARVRRGGRADSLDAWDRELAERAAPLIESRAEAAAALARPFADAAMGLGLEGEARLEYRPRAADPSVAAIAAELGGRREGEIERGLTGFGPHLDEVALTRSGRALRRYGSQGEQRVALLALLFAEREVLRAARRRLPLMLLDDVMSELDRHRRELLVGRLAADGHALITTTEPARVPAHGELSFVEIVEGQLRPGEGGPGE